MTLEELRLQAEDDDVETTEKDEGEEGKKEEW
jgi:hypothetical protein